MKKIFILLFSIWSVLATGQPEKIQIGILPSTYGSGMPLKEFEEFEKNVIKHIKKIKRFEIIRDQATFQDIDIETIDGVLKIKNNAFTDNIATPYLLHLVFGDTDWTASGNSSSVRVTPSNGNSRTARTPTSWSHSATVWLTLNLYSVSTGALENSIILTANSTEARKYKKVAPGPNSVFKNAITAAQKSLWNKSKAGIKCLFPLNLTINKIVDGNDKKAESVEINGGRFHGLSKKDAIYVYFEKEYMVRGKSTMRHIAVSKLSLVKVDDYTSIGKVKNGGKDIIKAMNEGKDLKCIIKDSNYNTRGYGF